MKLIHLKYLLLCSILVGLHSSTAHAQNKFIFFSDSEIEKMNSEISGGSDSVAKYAGELKQAGKKMLKLKPLSVTFHPSPAASKNIHDYFSEASYWWPDPKNPDAPYIRKDGQRNPDRFEAHRRDLGDMSDAVLILSANAYFFDQSDCADKAKEFIRIWFLDAKTKMNPHMKYAQSVRNKNEGRGFGILDSRSFSYVLEGVNFLKAAGKWDKDMDAELKAWFTQFLDWLVNSKNGIQEKTGGNNHSTWYAVQTAAIADFLRNEKVLNMILDFTKNDLIANQIEADGSCPRELARTNSLSYSTFNLDAYSMILRIAELHGINLWNYKNSKQGSVAGAVEYVFPYILEPAKWKYQQISKFSPEPKRFLLLAGEALGEKKYIDLYFDLSKAYSNSDAFQLLLNIYGKVYN